MHIQFGFEGDRSYLKIAQGTDKAAIVSSISTRARVSKYLNNKMPHDMARASFTPAIFQFPYLKLESGRKIARLISLGETLVGFYRLSSARLFGKQSAYISFQGLFAIFWNVMIALFFLGR